MLFVRYGSVPAESVAQVEILDAYTSECGFERISRELRMAPARREAPHVCEATDSVYVQKL
jgi:hypothetical protein